MVEPTRPNGPQLNASPRTLAVWCPDWPVVAALQAMSADLAGIADDSGFADAAAADVPPDRFAAVVFANRVVACSAAARAEGVRRGQRRREAQSRVPEIELFPHDPARDARAFEPVVAAVEELVPGVEILRPGLAVVAAKGATRYFGSEVRVGRVVAGAVRDVGHQARLGVADGSFAAVQAAYQAQLHIGSALDGVQPGLVSVPPGLVIVPPGGAAAFLAPLPVAALEDPELADLLGRLGIRTVGSFAALPADDVLARFGADGLRRHALARGRSERSTAGRPAPPELTVTTELDPPVERVDAATFAARRWPSSWLSS